MNNNNFKRQVIHHLAEEGVPESYDAWEAVKTQLEKNQVDRNSMLPTKKAAPRSFVLNLRSVGGIAMLLVLLIGIAFFLTPQSQVTAKLLLQLFWKAESNVLPLPTELPAGPILPTRTSVPTQIVSLQPIATGDQTAFITPTSKDKTVQGPISYGLSISEAEELAKFAIRVPKSLPSGYRLAETVFDSQTRTVQQIYKYSPYQSGEMFVLSQAPNLPGDSIGQSAQIEQIQVGDILVETVNGSWFSAAGSNQQEWLDKAPVHTYRWQQDGFIFTLQFLVGEPFSPAYLSKDDVQAVVAMVIGHRQSLLEKVNLNNLSSIEEAEQAAGFHLLAPTILPEGFVLGRIVYEPENKRAVFIFQPKGTGNSMNHPSLIIFEILTNPEVPPAQYPEILPPEAVEQVKIGEASGTLWRGTVMDGKYDPSSDLSLHWERNDLSITINYSGSFSNSAQLEKADLLKIAESLQ